MKNISFIVALFVSAVCYSQKTITVTTKIFFESGFHNTRVYVVGVKDTLLSKKLSTDYKIGYALILKVKDKRYKSLTIKAGKLTKKVQLRTGKFYTVNIRDNELIVDEVDEEPFYI